MNTVFLIWPCEITTVIQISNLYLGYNLSFYDIWWGKFDLKTNKSKINDPSKIHPLVGHSTFAKHGHLVYVNQKATAKVCYFNEKLRF